jgi:hypothetical protein
MRPLQMPEVLVIELDGQHTPLVLEGVNRTVLRIEERSQRGDLEQ